MKMQANERTSLITKRTRCLEIEDEGGVYQYRFECDDIPMWIFVRAFIFDNIFSTDLTECVKNVESNHIRWGYKLSEIIWFIGDLCKGVRNLPGKKIMSFGSSRDVMQKGNVDWNIYHEYFAHEFPDDTVLFEMTEKCVFGKENRIFKNLYHSESYKLIGKLLAGIVTRKISTKDEETTDAFLIYLQEQFQEFHKDIDWNFIEAQLKSRAKTLKAFKWIYRTLFRIVQPKIVFMKSACTMSSGHIVRWAKEQGIVVAEVLHGALGEIDISYHYGVKTQKSQVVQEYFSNYLLVYGDYFEKMVDVPCEVRSIGYPHFEETVRQMYVDGIEADANCILIACSNEYIFYYIDILFYLADMLPEFDELSFIFKPHPCNVMEKDKYNYDQLKQFKNVQIVENGTIYSCLGKAGLCIMAPSTSIFEAAGLGKLTMVKQDALCSTMISDKMGIRFQEKEDLLLLIRRYLQGTLNVKEEMIDASEIFKPNWKENYKEFLREIEVIHN